MMHSDGHSGGWVIAMAILMILFWGSIVAILWVGVRTLLHRPPRDSTGRQQPDESPGT